MRQGHYLQKMFLGGAELIFIQKCFFWTQSFREIAQHRLWHSWQICRFQQQTTWDQIQVSAILLSMLLLPSTCSEKI